MDLREEATKWISEAGCLGAQPSEAKGFLGYNYNQNIIFL